MSTIDINCRDQTLQAVTKPVIASGGVNEDTVNFTFCEQWNGFTKKATFFQDKNEVYEKNLVNNSCLIPHEAIAKAGTLYIGVIGTKDDVTRTTELLKYKIIQGAKRANAETQPPPSSGGSDGSGEGIPGEDGGYYIPSVNSSGVLSWTASKAGMPSVKSTNIKGADGDTPEKGVDYWTTADQNNIKSYCKDYIDTNLLGGAS